MKKNETATLEKNTILKWLYNDVDIEKTKGLTIGLETYHYDEYKLLKKSFQNSRSNDLLVINCLKQYRNYKNRKVKFMILVDPSEWLTKEKGVKDHKHFDLSDKNKTVFILDHSRESIFKYTDESWAIDENGKIKSVMSDIF